MRKSFRHRGMCEMGVRRAATDPGAHGGVTARNLHTWRWLWQEAERLTGKQYSL